MKEMGCAMSLLGMMYRTPGRSSNAVVGLKSDMKTMEEKEVALLGFLLSSEASLQSPCSRSLDLWEFLGHYWKSMSSPEQKGRKAD